MVARVSVYWVRGLGRLGRKLGLAVLGLMCRPDSVGETAGLLGYWVWSGVRLNRLCLG